MKKTKIVSHIQSKIYGIRFWLEIFPCVFFLQFLMCWTWTFRIQGLWSILLRLHYMPRYRHNNSRQKRKNRFESLRKEWLTWVCRLCTPSSDEDSNESGDSLVNTLKQVFPNPETMSPSFLLNFPAQAFGSDRRRLESNLKTYHHNEVVAYIFCTSNQRFKYSL